MAVTHGAIILLLYAFPATCFRYGTGHASFGLVDVQGARQFTGTIEIGADQSNG